MREIEFLPAWYPQCRRQSRVLYLQGWVAALLVVGLGGWMTLATRNVTAARTTLAVVSKELAQSELELTQLRQQLELKAQLEMQRQIVVRLGLPLEASRLIRTLDAAMPKEMSVQELSFDTEELGRPAQPADKNTSAQSKDQPVDRRLRVKMRAVAPSDVDLANFLAGLTNTPFFEQVAMTYSRDKSEGGHLMREFEVTFTMSLNHSVVANAN